MQCFSKIALLFFLLLPISKSFAEDLSSFIPTMTAAKETLYRWRQNPYILCYARENECGATVVEDIAAVLKSVQDLREAYVPLLERLTAQIMVAEGYDEFPEFSGQEYREHFGTLLLLNVYRPGMLPAANEAAIFDILEQDLKKIAELAASWGPELTARYSNSGTYNAFITTNVTPQLYGRSFAPIYNLISKINGNLPDVIAAISERTGTNLIWDEPL